MSDWTESKFGLFFEPFQVTRRDYGRTHSTSTFAFDKWWVLNGQGDIVAGRATEAEAIAEAQRMTREAAA